MVCIQQFSWWRNCCFLYMWWAVCDLLAIPGLSFLPNIRVYSATAILWHIWHTYHASYSSNNLHLVCCNWIF
jgi:hypothetical protein